MAPLDPSDPRRRAKHARYTQRQLDRAWVGDLNRQNTRKGSAARSAVYRVETIRRLGRAEARGISRGQALGHPGPGEQLISTDLTEWSEVPTTSGIVDITTTTMREASRVGRYLRDVRELLENRIDPSTFRHRWIRRVRKAGGYQLEADPNRVLALTFFNGPGPVDRYRRLEPGAAT
jgi:hypothetical protein